MHGTDLLLEITEREGVNADPVVLDAMRRIVDLEVRLAIDDFGVGLLQSSATCTPCRPR